LSSGSGGSYSVCMRRVEIRELNRIEKPYFDGPSTGEFNFSGGLMGNHAQEGKQNYPATILESMQ
ncbi:uncharacterized protein A4U43_C04F18880, partial [Asparagus officinalis]